MPPVPVLRPREVVKTFEKLGNLTDDYWQAATNNK